MSRLAARLLANTIRETYPQLCPQVHVLDDDTCIIRLMKDGKAYYHIWNMDDWFAYRYGVLERSAA